MKEKIEGVVTMYSWVAKTAAVLISMSVGSIALYTKFHQADAAFVFYALKMNNDQDIIRALIVADGLQTMQTHPDLFPTSASIVAGGKVFIAAWGDLLRTDCAVERIKVYFHMPDGEVLNLAEDDGTTVNLERGRNLQLVSIKIPHAMADGLYNLRLHLLFQCGQVSEEIKSPYLKIKVGN